MRSVERARAGPREELGSGRFILFFLPGSCPAESKKRVFNDQPEELRGVVVSFCYTFGERINKTRLPLIEASSERENDKVLENTRPEPLVTSERLSQLNRPLERLLTEENPSLVNRFALIEASPRPDRVKAFEPKADRIHVLMTSSAGWICPVLFEAHPERCVLIDLLDEAFDIRRRRRRGAAEERL